MDNTTYSNMQGYKIKSICKKADYSDLVYSIITTSSMGKVIHMNKQAYERVVGSVLSKQAGAGKEVAWQLLGNVAMPGVNQIGNTAGSIAGLFQNAPTKEELKEMNKDSRPAFLPGVGGNRLVQRRKAVAKMFGDKSPNARVLSQGLGPATSMLMSTLLGAGIGAGVGAFTGEPEAGALIGGGTGAGVASLANLLGTIGAGLSTTRTDKDQEATSGAGQKILNYTVPGVAAYDYFKTLGKSSNI